jgi:hypothetical protein
MTERAALDLTPKKGVIMLHTCLALDHDGRPNRVTITTNPLEFDDRRWKAQIVHHKTRSMNCAVQVARAVRRHYEIDETVVVHRSTRPVEAMIGYACTRSMTYPPSYIRDEINSYVAHVAGTPISALLEESAGGSNAARTRYTVYEVRSKGAPPMRAVSNKMHAVERIWRQCPPDTLALPDLVHVRKCETREEADRLCEGYPKVSDALWTRRPDPKYMARILKINYDEMPHWTSDGTLAVRTYDSGRVVVVGPHVYTLEHVLYCLARGAWYDGQFRRSTMPDLLTTAALKDAYEAADWSKP